MNPKIVLQNASGDISSVEFDCADMTFEFMYKTARCTELNATKVNKNYSETVAQRSNEFKNLLRAGYEVRSIVGDIDFLVGVTDSERPNYVNQVAKQTALGHAAFGSDEIIKYQIDFESLMLVMVLLSTIGPDDWVIPEVRVTFDQGQTCPVW